MFGDGRRDLAHLRLPLSLFISLRGTIGLVISNGIFIRHHHILIILALVVVLVLAVARLLGFAEVPHLLQEVASFGPQQSRVLCSYFGAPFAAGAGCLWYQASFPNFTGSWCEEQDDRAV